MRTTDTTTSDREDDPLTERLLADAGVGPGMRVLDLGTGAGDVALLAARIVGPSGRVVSVDRDLRTLMLAAVRCEREEIEHVDLAVGDLAVPVLPEGGFDAVVARSVLLDLPDPARTLRAAAARLRPGGVVCVQEAAEQPAGGRAAPAPHVRRRRARHAGRARRLGFGRRRVGAGRRRLTPPQTGTAAGANSVSIARVRWPSARHMIGKNASSISTSPGRRYFE